MSAMASPGSEQASVPPIQFPFMVLKAENRPEVRELQSRESRTEGMGNGLHARNNIDPGQLVAIIQKPLLNIVDADYIDSTCDNCMSTRRREGYMGGLCYSTVNSNGFSIPGDKMIACDGCQFLHYCNQRCREEAWANHHGAECALLKDAVKVFDSKLVNWEGFRAAIRLMCLRATEGGNYEQFFQQFLELQPHRIIQEYDRLDLGHEVMSWLHKFGLVEDYTDQDDSEVGDTDGYGRRGEFRSILFAMITHGVVIAHPKINIDIGTILQKSYIATGMCFDFYTSKFNHSCEPNCIWVFNKSELQLRAVKKIEAHEELTVSYDAYVGARVRNYDHGTIESHWKGDAHNQRVRDLEAWGFKCQCSLCVGPQFWPAQGGVLDRAVKPLLTDIHDHGLSGTILRLTELLFNADALGYRASFPSKMIHQQLCANLVTAGRPRDALRVSLEQYFLVETPHNLHVSLLEGLTSLQNLSHMAELHIEAGMRDTRSEEEQVLTFGLQLKLARETERCYGEDSCIAIHLRRGLRAEMEAADGGEMGIGKVEIRFGSVLESYLRQAHFSDVQIRRVNAHAWF